MLQKMQLARSVGISAALALTVVASGCGGSNSNNNQAVIAAFQLGQANFSDTTGNRGGSPTANTLRGATGIAINANSTGAKFFIADTGNNRILGFNNIPTTGSAVPDFVYGQSSMTTNTDTTLLNKPTSIKFSSDGTQLVVADSSNNRVLIWNTHLSSLSGTGVVTQAPDIIIGDSSASHLAGTSDSLLRTPLGASISQTKVIVADTGNNRVLIFNAPPATGATATVVLGQRSSTDKYVNCPSAATSAITCSSGAAAVTADSMYAPNDVWSDNSGALLVSDTGNNRVLVFPSMPTDPQEAATGVIGQTTLKVNNGPGISQTTLNQPRGVWMDPNTGIVYVADSVNNRVLGFDFPTGGGPGPAARAVYGQGDFIHSAANDDNQDGISDKNSGGQIQASDRTLSLPVGATTFGSATVHNKLYIADTQNSRLMVFDTY